ncbi:hypothetical protein MYG64_07420 [Ensifer adhaerens]|uniref:DUF6950 family protein n=1 Tax=Ensifer adhaerens TaxID=106592 RepID=UPI00210147D0|nr:hypothetical protein [Ensifer adhaerens]UTV38115.1 hypothetical protein MYG64_07420 [Ensifer adhaerens]
MNRLEAFFEAHALRPWQPGIVDCCLALADWAVECGYRDPASHLRGSYDSEEGFRAIIEEAGSVTALVGSCAACIGLLTLREPAGGAIGVIGSPTNIHRQFGAMYDGASWQVRSFGGFSQMVARPLAIWSI